MASVLGLDGAAGRFYTALGVFVGREEVLRAVRRALHMGVVGLFSIGVLAVVVAAVGFERTTRAVAEAGVTAFVAVGGLTFAFILAQAAAWAVLNRPVRHRVSFLTLLEASTVGLAGNILTPSSLLGGEPLKILYIRQIERLPVHEVGGTVVLSKYLEAISFVLFLISCSIVATVRYRSSLLGPYLPAGIMILVVAGALLVLCGMLIVSLSQRWRPMTRLMNWLRRFPLTAKLLPPERGRVRAMEDQVSRVFREEQGAAWLAFGILTVGQMAIFLKPALFFYLGAGTKLGIGELCLLFVVGQTLLAFQLTPSGAGVLDTGLLGSFALMGMDTPTCLAKCVAFLLCLRLWDIVVIGAGAMFAGREGARMLFFPQQAPPSAPPADTGPRPSGDRNPLT